MRFESGSYKWANLLWLVVFIFAISLPACSKKEKLAQRVVIKVNKQTMTAKEFSQKLATKLRQYDTLLAKDPNTISNAKKEILDDFTIQVITNDWAKANNIFVRKKLLDEKIQFYRSLYPDDLSFRRSLSEENLSYKEWRGKLKQSLLQELVSLELFKKTPQPSEEELKTYYEVHKSEFFRPDEVRLRQIVVKTKNDAAHIEKQLKKRKEMEKLARQFSISPEGQSGGDLGWIQKGTFNIFDQTFNMKLNQTSQVLKSPFGYHILKVIGKRKAKQLSFKEVKDTIKSRLLAEKEQIVYSDWLENEIRKTKVLKDNELLEKITVHTRGNG